MHMKKIISAKFQRMLYHIENLTLSSLRTTKTQWSFGGSECDIWVCSYEQQHFLSCHYICELKVEQVLFEWKTVQTQIKLLIFGEV